jgi:hypothetical protein
MWNLRSLKMSVMLVASGFALVAALPAKAQQVILTPGGTMLQMPAFDAMPLPTAPNPAVGAGSTPEAELPRYDILTPEQLNQGGKIVFRGETIEILAPNDPRISPEMQAAYPTDTVWYGVFDGGDSVSARMISITSRSAINFLAPLATISERRWDGIIEVGKVVPNSFFAGENVILANNDPRIPANLRDIDLGGFYYWAIDARSLNPSLPNNLFRPILYSRFVEYPFDSNNVSRETIVENVATRQVNAENESFLKSPLAAQSRREQMKLIVSNPEIYSLSPTKWGKPVQDIVDAQGNVVVSKQEIIAYRVGYAEFILNGNNPNAYPRGERIASSGEFETIFGPGDVDQWKTEIYGGFDLKNNAQFYRQLLTDPNTITWDQTEPPPLYPTFPETGSSANALPAIAPSVVPNAAPNLLPVNQIAPVITPAAIAISPTTIPAVTVQASQNPSADFATTRSGPRNTVPEQLNRGVVDSPLSNSRIFPGMR